MPAAPEAVQEELSTVGSGTPGPFEPPLCPESPTPHTPSAFITTPHPEETGAMDRGPSLPPPNPDSHTAICPISCYRWRRASPPGRPLSQALGPPPPACSRPGAVWLLSPGPPSQARSQSL